MYRDNFQPNRLPITDNDLSVTPVPTRRLRQGKHAGKSGFSAAFASAPAYDRSEPRGYSLMRTRRLIMAALRVWELKNGFHNPY